MSAAGANIAVGLTGPSFFQNGKLLAERDGVKRRSEELATEKEVLKVPPLPSLSHQAPRAPGSSAEIPLWVADVQRHHGRLRSGARESWVDWGGQHPLRPVLGGRTDGRTPSSAAAAL